MRRKAHAKEAPAATTPLFYGSVVPLNRDRHKALRLNTSENRFAFAAGSNVIPAVVDEFVAAARHLPIVFLPGAKHPSPVFLTGFRSGETLLIDGTGRWRGDYLPAFLRRYPFIVGDVAGAESIVCIDEQSRLFDDTGEPLFSAEGGDTAHLQASVTLMNEYRAAAVRTEHFVQRLMSLELFTGMTINVQQADVERQTVHGLTMVDQAKLDQLASDDFASLREGGFLAAIYAHLSSLSCMDKLNGPPPVKADNPVT